MSKSDGSAGRLPVLLIGVEPLRLWTLALRGRCNDLFKSPDLADIILGKEEKSQAILATYHNGETFDWSPEPPAELVGEKHRLIRKLAAENDKEKPPQSP